MKFDANRPDLTIGVLGTGAMGRGIVQVAAAGGMNVLMMDTLPTKRVISSRRCSRARRKKAA